MLGYGVFAVQVAFVAIAFRTAISHHVHWQFLICLGLITAYHGVMAVLSRYWGRSHLVQNETDSQWEIGRYSEADIYRVMASAAAKLPQRYQDLRIRIVDQRTPAAWTWLAFFWPGFTRTQPIILTSGCLYYLEEDELEFLILHEVGHHIPRHKLALVPNWLLTDLTLASAAVLLWSSVGSVWLSWFVFLIGRQLIIGTYMTIVGDRVRSIEHQCDLFAAEKTGSSASINALLKLGEDSELTDCVLAWVAKEMLYEPSFGMDDLTLAFQDARPYGRIFHANLFRHAAEVEKILMRGKTPRRAGAGAKVNAEFAEFLEQRRKHRKPRIRWRRFDRNGDGVLLGEEIDALCTEMQGQPNSVIVVSQDEAEPTSHPAFRDRILKLWNTQ